MKANLVQREPQMRKHWAEQKIYEQIREARKGAPLYILHDGPPYANGDIHMGHVINKVLKDFVVKYKTMTGLRRPLHPRLGLPRAADRVQGDDRPGPEGQGDVQARDPPGLHEVRRQVRQDPGQAVPGPRRLRRLREPVPDVQARPTRRASWRSSPSWSARAWSTSSSSRSTGASAAKPPWPRRSWNTKTSRRRASSSTSRPRTRRQRLIELGLVHGGSGEAGPRLLHDLDDDALDAGGQPGGRGASAPRVHRRSATRRTAASTSPSSRPSGVDAVVQAGGLQEGQYQLAGQDRPRQRVGGPAVQAPLRRDQSDRQGRLHGDPGRLRHDRGRHGPRAHGPRARPGRLHVGPEVRPGGLFAGQERRPVRRHRAAVASRQERARRGKGSERLAPGARLAVRPEPDSAQLSALLAEPGPGDLPRDGAVVRRAWTRNRPTRARRFARWRWRASTTCGGFPSWGQKRIAGMLESRPDWCISRQRSWGLPIPVFVNAGRPGPADEGIGPGRRDARRQARLR